MYYISLKVLFWLLFSDLKLFFKDFINNVIDAMCWPVSNIILSGYLMPAMGLPSDFGAFMIGGTIVSMCGYMTYLNSCEFVADLDGDRSISYELTLPIKSWMIYFKYAFSFAVRSMILNIVAFPLFKLFLFNRFSLNNFSFKKFVLIYFILNLFFGFFAVWHATFSGTIKKHGRLWIRFICILFGISGFQISWEVIFNVSKIMGCIILLSPWTYAYEGIRVAILGQEGFLNYWTCIIMLSLFTLLFGSHGLWEFKKKLDCII